MASVLRVINLEKGMPTVDEARRLLAEEMRKSRAAGVKIVKIIHGYGSSGLGGKLKPAILHSLAIRKRENAIRAYVAGEDWEVFNETARSIIDLYPEMGKDSDLGRANPGITIVLL